MLDVIDNNGYSISIWRAVTNPDGTIAESLFNHGPLSDMGFWNRIWQVEHFLLSYPVPFLDIRAQNIVVKNEAEGYKTPVFIDYKRIGIQTYPIQSPVLRFASGIRRKIRRRFSRLRDEYMVI